MELPLRKARAVDPSEDAFNGSIEEGRRQAALAARRQCYDVVTNALRSLKGQSTTDSGNTKISFSASAPAARLLLDEAARESYIRQIVQLSVRWPDNAFHECLYQTMIELGLTQELLELGGPDLVTFLQNAGNYETTKVLFFFFFFKGYGVFEVSIDAMLRLVCTCVGCCRFIVTYSRMYLCPRCVSSLDDLILLLYDSGMSHICWDI